MDEIRINKIFKPLFNCTTRYLILEGGRGSGKSFAVSSFIGTKLKEKGNVIWFSRYTMKNANESVIPEFNEKLDLMNIRHEFITNKYDIYHKTTGSLIRFRGIKTSEGIQTANLKGPKNMNIFVMDEAEEFSDERLFDKMDGSVRVRGKQNLIILIFNAPYRKHWIHRRFYKNAGVKEGFTGVKGNVTYIHSSYLNNIHNLDSSYLKVINDLKINDIKKYNEEYLGHWKDDPAGILMPRYSLQRFVTSELSNDIQGTSLCYIDVADQGTDYLCAVFVKVYDKKAYVIDIMFTQVGHKYTQPRMVALFRRHQTERAIFESNNQGVLYMSMIRTLCEAAQVNTTVSGLHNSTNKDSRILANSDFIIDRMYFKSDTDLTPDCEYEQYLESLTSYKLDGKNDHDDAADATAGMAKWLRTLLK